MFTFGLSLLDRWREDTAVPLGREPQIYLEVSVALKVVLVPFSWRMDDPGRQTAEEPYGEGSFWCGSAMVKL